MFVVGVPCAVVGVGLVVFRGGVLGFGGVGFCFVVGG